MKLTARSPHQIVSQRGRSTLLNALAGACFSFVAISNAYEHPTRTPAYIVLWALWMIVTLIWVFGVPGGAGFSKAERGVVNDELARSHQAAAAKVGLLCAMIGLVLLSLGEFFRIELPIWAVPAATSGTVVVTALFFAWLQLRHD
ncbi:hypothetical protein [Sphingomonas sp. R86521]|uniref:hypothetical protein n=1 Tax=Sphingomonas sp. R86521 TaxID=3093860 RepID=UPI0036D25C20